ncbi:MAG: cob(I)yrinic acid a,c-diamide adenosyltransferase [Rhodothermales bacterium]
MPADFGTILPKTETVRFLLHTRLMKIYTRTGDSGTTALYGGDRVPKHHPRIDAYGTVDETNALLGLVRSLIKNQPGQTRLELILARLQGELFVLGADLATPSESRAVVPRLDETYITQLEQDIDSFEQDLPALQHFILPGGTHAASTLHVARTVCRRAERLAVEVREQEALNAHIITYLNRLSDLLFTLARWTNFHADVEETVWHPQR